MLYERWHIPGCIYAWTVPSHHPSPFLKDPKTEACVTFIFRTNENSCKTCISLEHSRINSQRGPTVHSRDIAGNQHRTVTVNTRSQVIRERERGGFGFVVKLGFRGSILSESVKDAQVVMTSLQRCQPRLS